MRIVEIREAAVPLQANIQNAVVNFADHTVSLVAVVSDVDPRTASRSPASPSIRSAATPRAGCCASASSPA